MSPSAPNNDKSKSNQQHGGERNALSFDEDPQVNLQGLLPKDLKQYAIDKVELDALVLLKIIKHCGDIYPTPATGQLLGVDQQSTLKVTNCYPFTSKETNEVSAAGGTNNQTDEAAPVVLDGEEYQRQMLHCLRTLNYDASSVGWYQSTYVGSYWNASLLDTQYHHQETSPSACVLIYDPERTKDGNLNIKALRLSEAFMKVYKEKKFTMEALQRGRVTPSQVFMELPVVIKNSHLLNALLNELEPTPPQHPVVPSTISHMYSTSPYDAAAEEDDPLSQQFTNLTLNIEPYLSKHLEYLSDTIEEHGQEQWRWHGWQRNLVKEQSKAAAILGKKPGEASQRELMAVSPQLVRHIANEPSRLETLVVANQIGTYCKQVNEACGPGLSKMYMAKAVQGGKVE